MSCVSQGKEPFLGRHSASDAVNFGGLGMWSSYIYFLGCTSSYEGGCYFQLPTVIPLK